MKRGESPAVEGDWRLLETWDGAPGDQMALDEALLLSAEERPTLRFYTWRPDALSLGYFQRYDDIHERDGASVVVRRLTGGGAIHHRHELTFSIAAPAGHPLYRGEVAASYERVHGLVARALAELGITARLCGATPLRSDREESNMCFHASTPLDLVWDGAKGVGSAQRRSGGRVLHHGSIKLGTTPLEGDVATVRRHAAAVGPRELAARLRRVFEEDGARFSEEEASAAEREHVRARAAHFSSPAFLRRR